MIFEGSLILVFLRFRDVMFYFLIFNLSNWAACLPRMYRFFVINFIGLVRLFKETISLFCSVVSLKFLLRFGILIHVENKWEMKLSAATVFLTFVKLDLLLDLYKLVVNTGILNLC